MRFFPLRYQDSEGRILSFTVRAPRLAIEAEFRFYYDHFYDLISDEVSGFYLPEADFLLFSQYRKYYEQIRIFLKIEPEVNAWLPSDRHRLFINDPDPGQKYGLSAISKLLGLKISEPTSGSNNSTASGQIFTCGYPDLDLLAESLIACPEQVKWFYENFSAVELHALIGQYAKRLHPEEAIKQAEREQADNEFAANKDKIETAMRQFGLKIPKGF